LTFDLMCMSTFLMRIYELFLAKLFYSSNKVLSLLNRMLSHTTHKHGLSGTYCFVFVKEKYDPFIFWFSCLLCTFWGLLLWELIFLTHKLLMHFSCVQYGYWIILWVGEFFFFPKYSILHIMCSIVHGGAFHSCCILWFAHDHG
jgi:hypothetical protein